MQKTQLVFGCPNEQIAIEITVQIVNFDNQTPFVPFAWQGLLHDMESGCLIPWGLIQSVLILTTILMVWICPILQKVNLYFLKSSSGR